MSVIAMHKTKGFLQADGSFKPTKSNPQVFSDDLLGTRFPENGLIHYVLEDAFDALRESDLKDVLINAIVNEPDVYRVEEMLCQATGHPFEHDVDHIWRCGDALVTRDGLARMLNNELPSGKMEMAGAYADAMGLSAWVMAGGYILYETGRAA